MPRLRGTPTHQHTRTTFRLLLRSNTALQQAGLAKVNQMLHQATLVALADALAICIGEILLVEVRTERGTGEAVYFKHIPYIHTHTHGQGYVACSAHLLPKMLPLAGTSSDILRN